MVLLKSTGVFSHPQLSYLICEKKLVNERVVRKPAFYICKNKDADQLRGNREADQRLCFR